MPRYLSGVARTGPRSRFSRFCLLILCIAGLANSAPAQVAGLITGQVVDDATGQPIAGVRVHEQAVPTAQIVVTDQQGRFELPVPAGASGVAVAAALTYDPDTAAQYRTDVVSASDGDDVEIRLEPIPRIANLEYQPVVSTDGCRNCHADHWEEWQQSNHAGAAVNALVRDLYSGDGTGDGTGPSADGYVFTALHDAEESGFCAVCHAPNEQPSDPGAVRFDEVDSAPGLDGVTCTSCHQLHRVTNDMQAIHLLGNAEFRFPLSFRGNSPATHEHVWGPLDDVGFDRMRAAYAPVFSASRFCGSCHQYANPFTGAPGQETYEEWQQSPAAAAGIQCQDCHMPIAEISGTVSTNGQAVERPPEQRHDHSFHGVYSGVFGAPVELAMSLDIETDSIVVSTDVRNLVQGHHWPTGVDVRNAFLVVVASLNGQPLHQTAGGRVPDWASDDAAGRQTGDFGGLAGQGYAKVLEGRINGQDEPISPVSFIDAERLIARTTIPAGESESAGFTFDLPAGVLAGDELVVRARVIYRRAWRAIAVTKNWPEVVQGEPFERLVVDMEKTHVLTTGEVDLLFASGFES